MIIETPGPNGTVIEKIVQTGGGVVIRVPGTLYNMTCQVVNIDESDHSVEIKGVAFTGWVLASEIKDVLSPGTFALDNAINVIGNKDK